MFQSTHVLLVFAVRLEAFSLTFYGNVQSVVGTVRVVRGLQTNNTWACNPLTTTFNAG